MLKQRGLYFIFLIEFTVYLGSVMTDEDACVQSPS